MSGRTCLDPLYVYDEDQHGRNKTQGSPLRCTCDSLSSGKEVAFKRIDRMKEIVEMGTIRDSFYYRSVKLFGVSKIEITNEITGNRARIIDG